ncbi:MAG: methyltransferase type 12, partial [Gammaproteobacteria bacterium]|nr:methyltransferase type 12 [Gammaproteobacteria bacterium]
SISAKPSFDCIIYIDVLEHIKNDYEEMRLACERLRIGGKLIVLSPAHQWLFTEFDLAIGHFRRYTTSSLDDVAVRLPLNKVALFYLDSAGLLLSLANKLLLKQRMPSLSQIRIWDKAIVPISRILDRCLAFRMGKTVIGIWEK